MTLNQKQCNVLEKIARNSNMDCWFYLDYTPSKGHFVKDLENNGKRISLRQGVKQLIDGCINLNIDELLSEEKFTLIQLLGDLI